MAAPHSAARAAAHPAPRAAAHPAPRTVPGPATRYTASTSYVIVNGKTDKRNRRVCFVNENGDTTGGAKTYPIIGTPGGGIEASDRNAQETFAREFLEETDARFPRGAPLDHLGMYKGTHVFGSYLGDTVLKVNSATFFVKVNNLLSVYKQAMACLSVKERTDQMYWDAENRKLYLLIVVNGITCAIRSCNWHGMRDISSVVDFLEAHNSP